MKLKQKPLFFLVGIIFAASFSSIISVMQPQVAQALKCPGEEYPTDFENDLVCKKKELIIEPGGEPKKDAGGNPYGCYDDEVFHNHDKKCYVYTHREVTTANIPTRDDGTPLTDEDIGCDKGYEYDKSTNRCKNECGGHTEDGEPTGCTGKERNPIKTPKLIEKEKADKAKAAAEAQCKKGGGKWVNGACETEVKAKDKADCEKSVKDGGKGGKWVEEKGKPGKCITTKTPGGGGNSDLGGNTIDRPKDKCGTARVNLIPCSGTGVQAIGDVLRQAIQVLSIIIGLVAVGGIGYAAVLYASATDNAGQAQNAINIIRNIVIGILVYGFMIAIINWLIPSSSGVVS